ncbi:unnamed protein product [Clonostachys chloroleuca]|uniref:Pyruvate decarboxylase n=1 Tax=Clonostachys chloroleuca TaxID=1926264 RepID=A0AA35M2V2_9HYPO|nr:unnamed protein product [Clonostachys chloroleuca]
MTQTIGLTEYLFARLKQLGVGAIHGLPGDFNLTLLDFVEPSGLTWVGNANELNAGYAADGYARIKGLGALITTFGVGELSAINAIAGAYAERVPVVHIVGVPSRELQDSRAMVHHTFNDGDFGRFALMAAHVTVGQEKLWDPRDAPQQIDSVLRKCLVHSRPVYIEIPVDMVDAQVSRENLNIPVTSGNVLPGAGQATALEKVLQKMASAKQPVILVDGETRSLGIVDEVRALVNKTGWPTWTTGFGKSIIDETLPNFHGLYRGGFASPEAREFFEGSDLVLFFGAHPSTTNSFHLSALPSKEKSIWFKDTNVLLGSEIVRDVPMKALMTELLKQLEASKFTVYETYPSQIPTDTILSFDGLPRDQPVTQDRLWKVLANFIRPGDIVMGETGTPGYGVREFKLPENARMVTFSTWLSIGYMLPAAQGAALAQRELQKDKQGRTILLIGDGSFQLTAQEIATMVRQNLDIVIFLFNNDGYTIERCIHGANQGYNDVSPWRYLQAASFFGAPEDSYTKRVKTWGDLEETLGDKVLSDGRGIRMAEIILDRDDAPEGPLKVLMSKQKPGI